MDWRRAWGLGLMPDSAGTSLILPWAATLFGLLFGAMMLGFVMLVSGKRRKDGQ